MAMALTGCASLTPASGRALSYTPRENTAPAPAPSPSAESPAPPRLVTAPEEPGRLHRRKGVREVVTGASPIRTTVALASPGTRVDAWEQLLTDAGLEAQDERPLSGGALTPTQAVRLLGMLLRKPATLGNLPPRMAVSFLLREVLEGGAVSREELLRRVERFSREQVAVLRPDGYLAWTLNGHTQQKVAPVEWRDGAFRAGNFELGRFYSGKGGVFRAVDAQFQPSDWRPLAEVYDDADVISRSLDGAQDAFVELYHALGQVLSHPTDSIAGLRNLPAGVAALIASSPAYWERFRSMTEGEQIREVARLATSVIATCGAASATTRTVTGLAAGAEAMAPVLSMSAGGALALGRVAVPVGSAVDVLGGGPGAAFVLHRANVATGQPTPSGGRGPGQWAPSEEKGASPRARAYQEQLSGHSYDEAYWVGGVGRNSGGVKFDGFKDGVLLETKGLGYAEFFEEGLAPKYWFEASGKAGDLVDQAIRQRDIVRGTGIRIEWHVAEKHAADAIRKLLKGNDVTEIAVIHTPARPLVP